MNSSQNKQTFNQQDFSSVKSANNDCSYLKPQNQKVSYINIVSNVSVLKLQSQIFVF